MVTPGAPVISGTTTPCPPLPAVPLPVVLAPDPVPVIPPCPHDLPSPPEETDVDETDVVEELVAELWIATSASEDPHPNSATSTIQASIAARFDNIVSTSVTLRRPK